MNIKHIMAVGLTCLLVLYIPCLSTAQERPVLVPFHKGNLWGYSDTAGRLIIQPKFTEAGFFREENNLYYAQGKVGEKRVIISADGKFMDDDSPEDNGMAINDEGLNEKIDARATGKSHLQTVNSDKLMLAGKDDLFGFVDSRGKLIIPFVYTHAKAFGAAPAIEDFAWVTNQDGVSFFIDKKGREYYSK